MADMQEPLFEDKLTFLCGNDHPLRLRHDLTRAELCACAWVVPRQGTPTRDQFDAFFAETGPLRSVIEAGSILLMREIIGASDQLGCISGAQAAAEVSKKLLSVVTFNAGWMGRPISLTYRKTWTPTVTQSVLLAQVRKAAAILAQ